MKLVFLGPPGVGKGTQAKILAGTKHWAHISTGEMLREAVAESSELGREVKEVIDSGHLVSDELILKVIHQRLEEEDCKKGYILDGFPRTLKQAEQFEQMFKGLGGGVDLAISFALSEEEVMRRLEARRAQESRVDDNEEVQLKRMRVYHEQTAPLIDFYRKRNLLSEISADGSVEEVVKRVAMFVDK